jgi:hypothetical protein
MIDRAHDLPITRQAEALNVSRSSAYYLPRAVPETDLLIMRRLDQLHLGVPLRGIESSAASDLPCCGGEFPKVREIKFSAIAEHDERFRRKGEAYFLNSNRLHSSRSASS